MLYPVKIYELMLKFTCIGFLFLVLTTTCSGVPSNNTTIILGLPSITPQTIKGIVSNTPTPTTIGSETSYFTLTVELDSQEDIDLSIIPTSTISGYVENWQDLPVIPQPGLKVLEIYERGLALGNNPQAFSKIGDCGSTPTWFLGDFDRGKQFYNLGDYTYLESTIKYYKGSFNRISLSAKSGFNASSVLTPLWSDKTKCKADESPLACEYRIHKPIMAFITLGANDVYHLESFETQIKRIVEYSIENGVIPILSTKPDNIEKTHQINVTIARIAKEYEIPLWNYWLAVQPLPNHGLQEDGVHITWRANWFDKKDTFNWGWPVRNLSALQILNEIWLFTSENISNP